MRVVSSVFILLSYIDNKLNFILSKRNGPGTDPVVMLNIVLTLVLVVATNAGKVHYHCRHHSDD